MSTLGKIVLTGCLCGPAFMAAAAEPAFDFDAPDALANYDRNLCEMAQRLLLNSHGDDVDIVVNRAAAGGGFGTLQMDIEADNGKVVVAMLTEQVDVDGETLAVSVWCKMVNQERVNDVLGKQLAPPPRSCRDVNESTYRLALATLSPEQRQDYEANGTPLRFVDDYNAGAGSAWIPAIVNDYMKTVEGEQGSRGYVRIQAPSVQVDWDPEGRDWYKGTHHCKVITLVAMRRWMTGGALAGDTELFPRSTPVCTQPSSLTSTIGSCLQFFGPANSMFCTDFSGSGWTVEAARAECDQRHTTKAAWIALDRRYVGAGGIFSVQSCTARNAVGEVRRPPIEIADSGHFGICVFRCNQADETLWHALTDVPASNQGKGGMARACDLFIPPEN